jgi:predicted ATPase
MRGNQVFVETHSEHLILRLQVLVAEGRIGRDQISLFFFENQTGDARIRRVTLGSRAEPVGKWPSGFFDVGVDLARLLSAARLKATK